MPKKHRNLFEYIASFTALHEAALRTICGKRGKPGAAGFMANLERNLLRIERMLREGTWRGGGYTVIEVRDPKPRMVSAAPFADRVVHHALCAVVEPIFERGFIADSYANRKGYGTHRAIARYEHYRDRHAHVLRCDIYRYFPSIDHAILKADLRRRIACEPALALMDTIIDGSNPQEPVNLLLPGDDLFSPHTRRRGMPLGNLTSQLFGNIYLDGIDHFVKEVLRAPGYVRYVDDFILFHDDPAVLAVWQAKIARYLEGRRLVLHPVKTRIAPCAEPAGFSASCCMATGTGVCRRPACAASATACAACATAGARGRLRRMRLNSVCKAGLPTRNMRIPGACAMPSFAAGGLTRRGSLSARLTGARFAAARGTTNRRTCARPTATTTNRRNGTTTTGFAWPVCLRLPEPVRLRTQRVCVKASTGSHDERSAPLPFCLRRDGRGFPDQGKR